MLTKHLIILLKKCKLYQNPITQAIFENDSRYHIRSCNFLYFVIKAM